MSPDARRPNEDDGHAEKASLSKGMLGADERRMVSLRLTSEGRRILQERASAMGISQAALIELLLRAGPVYKLPDATPR